MPITNKILAHVIYWATAVLFFGAFWGSDFGEYYRYFYTEVINLPGKMAVTYFVMYVSIPYFLVKKRYIGFTIAVFVPVLLGSILQHYVENAFIFPKYPPSLMRNYFLNPYDTLQRMVDINTIMAIPVLVRILEYYYKNKQAAEVLAREKLLAELRFLKNQIHPHFLFNTLNSLYSLTLKKSDKAPDVVLRLSDLLRYLLHETNSEKVSLAKEIEYIKSYIELEKLRFGDRVEISFNTFGEPEKVMVAPLLFLPFVENSFKHGVSKETSVAWIVIEVSIVENSLVIKVENSVPKVKEEIDEKDISRGIGLANVKRRLDLLYHGKHELKLFLDEYSHSVILKLELE